jgi:CheY-like chemotaxis protein/HD-like signal output (HDOD) protein
MKGVVARGNHRLAAVSTVAEAWGLIQRNVAVDLVFLELKLEGENGLGLVQRLRGDCFLKLMPVVIYTGAGDRDTVRQAMQLKVQNFLVKPYRDDYILAEIAKATANPWRGQHFEEEKSFCAMTGFTPEGLRKELSELRSELETLKDPLLEFAKIQNPQGAADRLGAVASKAEAAGAWGVVEYLNDVKEKAEQSAWPAFGTALMNLPFAERLIFAHLNPGIIPEDFVTAEERNRVEEARQRALWFNAPAEGRCPVLQWPQIATELEALKGCPVVDSVAASFQMSATGRPSSLDPLMELTERDPGLCAELLLAANQMRRSEENSDHEPVENPRICVSFLGEIKLAAIASKLVKVEERWMDSPPCSWTAFWMFQVGVARMARYTCHYLEFQSLESRAYAAGLMHDLGKILLVHLHPLAFQAIVDYSRRQGTSLPLAEQKFIGCTTHEMAAHFAEKHEFPSAYANVMRWVHEPEQAADDQVLVAIVSLARDLCRQNRVGWSGDSAHTSGVKPVAESPAWQVLSQRVFPSFNLHKFEAEAHAECRQLKRDLHGQFSLPAV